MTPFDAIIEVENTFPDLKNEIVDYRDLPDTVVGFFMNYTQKFIDAGDKENVKKCCLCRL